MGSMPSICVRGSQNGHGRHRATFECPLGIGDDHARAKILDDQSHMVLQKIDYLRSYTPIGVVRAFTPRTRRSLRSHFSVSKAIFG
jgi:hypothetical protein